MSGALSKRKGYRWPPAAASSLQQQVWHRAAWSSPIWFYQKNRHVFVMLFSWHSSTRPALPHHACRCSGSLPTTPKPWALLLRPEHYHLLQEASSPMPAYVFRFPPWCNTSASSGAQQVLPGVSDLITGNISGYFFHQADYETTCGDTSMIILTLEQTPFPRGQRLQAAAICVPFISWLIEHKLSASWDVRRYDQHSNCKRVQCHAN